MDRETRDDLVVVIVYVAVVVFVMIVFRPERFDALASRLRHPAGPLDTMEARIMPQVQKEISMMEHGCGD